MSSFRQTMGYFWVFVRPYRLAFFAQFFLAILRIIFSLILTPFVYKNIVDVLSNTNIDFSERSHLAFLFLIPMVAGSVLSAIVNRYREFVGIKFTSNIIKDIYDFSFKRLIGHSYKFYSDHFTGSIVAKIKRLTRAFEIINRIIIGTFWFVLIYIISAVVVLYSQSKVISLYFLLWSVAYIILTSFFVKKKMRLDIAEAESDSKISGVLADSLTNILNIKIFSSSDKEFKYFGHNSLTLKSRIYESAKFGFWRSVLQTIMMVAFQAFILYTMIRLWSIGEITVGVFILTYVYLFSIFERVWDLSEDVTTFMKAVTDMKEAVDIFDAEMEVKDPIHPEVSSIQSGVIEFKHVSFSYMEESEVFEDFNLKINSGEKIGLVGHSGSGKSTITKLLLRFMDIQNGEILIDGQNISKIKQDDLRNKISYVPQESILFHRSLRENILYSKPNATDEEVFAVAKKAHAHEFIVNLSKGYDTLVGERGVKLSGGERQRVAIARAMLKEAPILVLDEATSSLDSISETYIQEAFDELMKGKTTIVIAHRLSTIQKMDRIIVLDKGKIVEEGTHKALLAKKGFYAELWNHQTGGFLEE